MIKNKKVKFSSTVTIIFPPDVSQYESYYVVNYIITTIVNRVLFPISNLDNSFLDWI